PDDDQLARWSARERLRDRDKREDCCVVVRQDEDRALDPGLAGRGRVEVLVLPEDRLLELSEGWSRLDSELVDERPACFAIGLEGVGLPTGAVEGEHEQAAESLAERMLGDERFEL